LEGGLFDLYEIIPGFAAASFSILMFCKFTPEKNPKLLKQFDDIKSEINS